MPRNDDIVDRLLDPAIAQEVAKLRPRRRKNKPMSDETRLKMAEYSADMSNHPLIASWHKPGRPKGSKNKPKAPVDLVAYPHLALKRKRQHKRPLELSLATVKRIACIMSNGVLRGLDSHGKVNHYNKVRRLHGTREGQIRYAEQPNFQYLGQWYPAANVAFWLLFDQEIPEGWVPRCDDMREIPSYTRENMYLLNEKNEAAYWVDGNWTIVR